MGFSIDGIFDWFDRNILKLIFQEYPNCLDLEFVEGFLSTTREKIDIYNANFHPITHFDFPTPALTSILTIFLMKIKHD